MASLNRVMIIGNLTRDVELRYTPKGTAVAELGIAINSTRKGDNGEKREDTTFVDVVAWGRAAELAGEYLKKGRPVYIEGRLQLDAWDDKQTGQKRSKLRVVCAEMQFLGGGEQREERSQSRQARPSQAQKPPADPDLDTDDQDIPF